MGGEVTVWADADRAVPVTFECLFADRYGPMVLLATALVDERAIAEEVVQECFGRLWQRFDTVDNPAGYLRTSVVHGCRQELRRREVRRRHAAAEAAPDRLDGEHHFLLDALDHLSERKKTALVLRFYGGFSMNEIAAAMSIRPGTAKSLISRGLADLRKVIR